MLRRTKGHTAAVTLAALGALVALAPAAGAARATFPVAGRQIVVDESAGTSLMRGGLRGAWKTTSFDEIEKTPIYRAQGTESFAGCLDRRRDGSCAGDPSGTLQFSFLYWGQFDASDTLVWGACYHPITGGTGAFRNATGVLMFVDTPVGDAVRTAYTGNVTLDAGVTRSKRRAAARSAGFARPGCGPR